MADADDVVIAWLMKMTTHVAELHAQRKPNEDRDLNTIAWEDEGFSRWMGWRGQDEQERETTWPADMLRTERNARHMKFFHQLREENAELRSFLRALRDELNRRLGT